MAEHYRVEWDNADKTVVLQTYLTGVTPTDIYQMAYTSADMLETVDHTVHIIIMPSGRRVMNAHQLNQINKLVPENQGAVLVVGSTYEKLLKKMGEKIALSAVKDSEIIGSVADARQFLIEHYGVVYP